MPIHAGFPVNNFWTGHFACPLLLPVHQGTDKQGGGHNEIQSNSHVTSQSAELFRFRENSKHTVHKETQQYFLYHYECDTKFLYFPLIVVFLNIIMFLHHTTIWKEAHTILVHNIGSNYFHQDHECAQSKISYINIKHKE